MGITIEWIDEQRLILCHRYSDPWTWEEHSLGVQTGIQRLLQRVPQRADVIFDFSRSKNIPRPDMMPFLRSGANNMTPNLGLLVICGGSRFLNTMIHTFKRLNPTRTERWQLIATFEEALALIEHDRATKGE
ncbi:MAG: hypothetical protein MUF87_08225 [Anaerolineae bacterium]|jgi:hypothetical protein|nr:hypothetical protein [Anaerolineae bacterium]